MMNGLCGYFNQFRLARFMAWGWWMLQSQCRNSSGPPSTTRVVLFKNYRNHSQKSCSSAPISKIFYFDFYSQFCWLVSCRNRRPRDVWTAVVAPSPADISVSGGVYVIDCEILLIRLVSRSWPCHSRLGSDRVCGPGWAAHWRSPLHHPEEGDPGQGARWDGHLLHSRPGTNDGPHLYSRPDPWDGSHHLHARPESWDGQCDSHAHACHCNRLRRSVPVQKFIAPFEISLNTAIN